MEKLQMPTPEEALAKNETKVFRELFDAILAATTSYFGAPIWIDLDSFRHVPAEFLEQQIALLKVEQLEEKWFVELDFNKRTRRLTGIILSSEPFPVEDMDGLKQLTPMALFEIVLNRCRRQIIKDLQSGRQQCILVPIYPLNDHAHSDLVTKLLDAISADGFIPALDELDGEDVIEICT